MSQSSQAQESKKGKYHDESWPTLWSVTAWDRKKVSPVLALQNSAENLFYLKQDITVESNE